MRGLTAMQARQSVLLRSDARQLPKQAKSAVRTKLADSVKKYSRVCSNTTLWKIVKIAVYLVYQGIYGKYFCKKYFFERKKILCKNRKRGEYLASIKNLRALVDWFQIQVSDELCVYEIADEMLKIPIEQFLERKGRLEYYTYDRVLEHASVRIHFHSEEIKNEVADNSKMVIMSGQALEFYRSEVLAKEQKSFREFLKQLFTDYSDVFSIKRADPAIDDFNFPSFFTPKQLLKVCEKKRFLYGKSTFYDVYGNETREKGMNTISKTPVC